MLQVTVALNSRAWIAGGIPQNYIELSDDEQVTHSHRFQHSCIRLRTMQFIPLSVHRTHIMHMNNLIIYTSQLKLNICPTTFIMHTKVWLDHTWNTVHQHGHPSTWRTMSYWKEYNIGLLVFKELRQLDYTERLQQLGLWSLEERLIERILLRCIKLSTVYPSCLRQHFLNSEQTQEVIHWRWWRSDQ